MSKVVMPDLIRHPVLWEDFRSPFSRGQASRE